MTIDELLVALGFEFDEESKKELDKLKEGLTDATKLALKLAAGVAAGTAALIAFTKVVSNSNDRIGKTAKELGLTVEELEALGVATEMVTGNAEGLDGQLKSLARTAAEASEGLGEGAEVFARLNVDLEDAPGQLKKVDDILLQTLENLQSYDELEQIRFLEKLGIGNLNLAVKDLAAFKGELQEALANPIITQEDADRAAAFNDSFTKIMRVIKSVGTLIASSLSPALTEMTAELKEWIQLNRDELREEVIETFQTIGQIIFFLLTVTKNLLDILKSLIRLMGGLNNVLKITAFILGLIFSFAIGKALIFIIGLVKALTLRMILLNAQILLIPTIIGALILLIGLLIEDIIGGLNGKRTMFDVLIDKFPSVKSFFEKVETVITDTIEFWTEKWEGALEFMSAPFDLTNWKIAFDAIVNDFEGFMSDLGKLIIDGVNFVVDPIKDALAAIGIGEGSEVKFTEEENLAFAGDAGLEFRIKQARARVRASQNVGAAASANLKANANSSRTITTNNNSELKLQVEIKGDATGVDKRALNTEVTKAVQQQYNEALKNIETGTLK